MTDLAYTVTVRTTVNGAAVERDVPVRRTLVEFLREDLGLTGTKISCELQVCGACTVLVDGRPVSSCTCLASDVDGCTVTTVEGLTNADGSLHTLQEAFVEEHALQCGFCTPGFLMMSAALLAERPAPDRKAIIEHLDGNICRCTGYAPIIRAVERAVERAADCADDWAVKRPIQDAAAQSDGVGLPGSAAQPGGAVQGGAADE